ncbi:MAG: hypothetical protein AAGA38_17030 [Pseudomonadota bacterium]
MVFAIARCRHIVTLQSVDDGGPMSISGLNIEDPEVLFAAAPWNLDETRSAEAQIDVPTMLSPEERRLYYWVARHWAQDAGALVDLGAFAGGSTARLAAGLAARRGTERVYAYDRFTVDEKNKARILYRQGVPEFKGNDLKPLAEQYLRPWKDQIFLRHGEIQDIGWDGGPIEVLAVDAAKHAARLDIFASHFYPRLIPGRSILIQQDFLAWNQPWLMLQMLKMSAAFHPIAYATNSTVLFMCTAPVTSALIASAEVGSCSDQELIDGVREMRDRLEDWGMAARFRKAIAGVRANPGKRISWQMRAPRQA